MIVKYKFLQEINIDPVSFLMGEDGGFKKLVKNK